MLVPFRSPITTCAPSRRKVSAVARPMPLAPPVMIATLPSSRPFMSGEPSLAQKKNTGAARAAQAAASSVRAPRVSEEVGGELNGCAAHGKLSPRVLRIPKEAHHAHRALHREGHHYSRLR